MVDWSTIAVLTGLLILTKGVEVSATCATSAIGSHCPLHASRKKRCPAPSRLLRRCYPWRSPMMSRLFVVAPLTLGLRTLETIPVTRLVVFEALAVNTGSALTPTGNPQNLFLWQYIRPLVLPFCRRNGPAHRDIDCPAASVYRLGLSPSRCQEQPGTAPAEQKASLVLAGAVFAVFNACRYEPGRNRCNTSVIHFFITYRQVLGRVDWPLIVVFVLMFVDVRLIAEIPLLGEMITHTVLNDPRHFFIAGILISQFISNVPTAILLAEYSGDWKLIAHARISAASV